MRPAAAPRVELGAQAPGLVVMLDQAGRTIASLEDRVDALTAALAEERQQRAELERLLAQLRSALDTPYVAPQTGAPVDTWAHATDPARPRDESPRR